MWPQGSFDWWWDGEEWQEMPLMNGEEKKVFANGWRWAEETQTSLPAIEHEIEILASSAKRIIKSTSAQVCEKESCMT
jgi:hypothetical protein